MTPAIDSCPKCRYCARELVPHNPGNRAAEMSQPDAFQRQASAAGHDSHQHFPRARLRHRSGLGLERSPELFKDHCLHLHYISSFSIACTNCHIISGLSGISIVLIPRAARASSTALTIAGGAPIQPDSPTPFAPSGLSGGGFSMKAVTKWGSCPASGKV